MTTAKKVFRIKIPFDLESYRKGYRYSLSRFTTEEVTFLKMTREKNMNKVTTETHKLLDIGKRMPFMVRKVVPTAACLVEEFSTSVDSIRITEDGNKDSFCHFHQEAQVKQNDLNVEKERTIDTINVDGIKHVIADEKTKLLDKEGKELPVEEAQDIVNERLNVEKNETVKNIKEKTLKNDTLSKHENELKKANDKKCTECATVQANCQKKDKSTDEGHFTTTKYKNRHFDEKTFKMSIDTKVTTNPEFKFNTDASMEDIDFRTYFKEKLYKTEGRDYTGNYEERYECVYVYKLVEIEINARLLGWVAKEILKLLKETVIEVQRDLVKHYPEWKDMNDEELDKYEDEVVKKFMKSK